MPFLIYKEQDIEDKKEKMINNFCYKEYLLMFDYIISGEYALLSVDKELERVVLTWIHANVRFIDCHEIEEKTYESYIESILLEYVKEHSEYYYLEKM